MGARGWLADYLIRCAGHQTISSTLAHAHAAVIYSLGIGSATHDHHINGERHLLELVRDRIDGSLTIFDVGAHSGGYATIARSILGMRATIHCFEPDVVAFARLTANLRSVDRIWLHNTGLSDREGLETLYADMPGSLLSTLCPPPGHSMSGSLVRLTTVDAVCRTHDVSRIDLLKVDVEGGELAVLAGATSMLSSGQVGIVQFEFGQNNLESRTYLRDFVGLLGPTHDLYRVAKQGLVSMGPYKPMQEIFVSATNYAAVPRVRIGESVHH